MGNLHVIVLVVIIGGTYTMRIHTMKNVINSTIMALRYMTRRMTMIGIMKVVGMTNLYPRNI